MPKPRIQAPALDRAIAAVRDAAAAGRPCTASEIRKRFDLSLVMMDTLRNRLREYGLAFTPTRQEMTRDLIAQIMHLHGQGFGAVAIANAVGRKRSTVETVIKRELELAELDAAHKAEAAAGQGEKRESEAPPPAANSMVMSLMARGLSRENAERQAKWEMHKRVHGLMVTEPAW